MQVGGHKRVVLSGYDTFCKVLVKNADWSSSRSPKTFGKLCIETSENHPGKRWGLAMSDRLSTTVSYVWAGKK